MGPLGFFLLLVTVTYVGGQVDIKLCTSLTCKPTECYCPTTRIPMDIFEEDVPQMVLFSFGGALDYTRGLYIKDMFNKKRRNPNGSRIRATLFVSDDEGRTDYCTVGNLWSDGHEVASAGVTRQNEGYWRQANRKRWQEEIDLEKEYIAGNTSIPEEDITGFRSPLLQPGGDVQYGFALSSNWTYDSTMVLPAKYDQDSQSKLWPYTMDFVPTYECYKHPCPTLSYPGVWQVPIQSLTDNYGMPCKYLDNCPNLPDDAEDIFNILMRSFNRSYNGNRVPVMVNFENYKRFFETNTPWALDGVNNFINELLSYAADDVWFVTYQDMIDWMLTPTELKIIKFFPPFTRDLDDRKGKTCIEEAPVENFTNGVNLLIAEVIACVVTYVVLYFNED